MKRGKPMKRSGPIGRSKTRSVNGKRAAEARKLEKRQAHRDAVWEARNAVKERSGGWCEWPGCRNPATDWSHSAQRSTSPHRRYCHSSTAFLCRSHHQLIDTPEGKVEAERFGFYFKPGMEPPCTCPNQCTSKIVRLDSQN